MMNKYTHFIKIVLQELANIKEIYILAKKTSLGVVFAQVDIKDFNAGKL